MNYTNNVPCHTIKPLERKWFRYLVRQIDYNYLSENYIVRLSKPLGFYIDEFSTKYGIGEKMLYYYMNKWKKRKIFYMDNDTFTPILFLEFNKYKASCAALGWNLDIYRFMVPYRVFRLFHRAECKFLTRDQQ